MIDLPTLRREVRVAHLADRLDAVGLRGQCVTPSPRPLAPQMRFIGRAFTVVTEVVEEPPAVPYRGLLRALDHLGEDDVYVIPTGGDARAACWGELLSTRASAVGAAGAVTDGAVRDIAQTVTLGFPTFSDAATPNDIHGRYEVVDHNLEVTLGGVKVVPGDLIAGDIDGVVVVPREVEAEVCRTALEKARTESRVCVALAEGMLPSAAFERYGVL